MKFVQLILRKMIKIVATRCQILRLKCTEFDFDWGSAPDPTGGAYSAPPDLMAGFEGPTSKTGEGREKGRGGRRREGRGGLSGNVAEEAFCLKSAPGYAVRFYPRDAWSLPSKYVCLSVCPSHAGIVSKQLNLA